MIPGRGPRGIISTNFVEDFYMIQHIKGLGLAVLDKISKYFPIYIYTRGKASFDPRGIIWIILVDDH